jgi:putative transposase
MKYWVIRETAKEHKTYSITKMCRILNVSHSGYYEWRGRGESRRKKKDLELKEKIRATYEQNKKRYGSPRIHDALDLQGIKCSKKRIERLMREMGIQAKHKRQFKVTTKSNHDYPVANNLLDRNFQADAPNQKWVADITYIRTFEGWLYLAAVMDLYSRKIIGWAMAETMTATLATTALEMAIQRRHPLKGLLHHSDRGVQYASKAYQKILKKYGTVCSMSRKGNCWDNAPMESFFSTLKAECIAGKIYLNRILAKREIFEYIEVYYNRKRLHSAIGSMIPDNYENQRKCA